MAASRIPPEIESDDEDAGEWEEWQEAGADAGEEQGEGNATQCFFCVAVLPSPQAVFQHCLEAHSFDFLKLRADARLDFYDTLRVINFIRAKVAERLCWSCGAAFESQDSLLEHLKSAKHSVLSEDSKQTGPASSSTPSWKDDKYLTPFLEDDPLLYSFDDDGEDDDSEEFNAADKTTALRELLGGNSDKTACSSGDVKLLGDAVQIESLGANDLADLQKVFLSLGEGMREELANPLDVPFSPDSAAHSSAASLLQGDETLGAAQGVGSNVSASFSNGDCRVPSGLETRLLKKKDRKDLKVTFAEVAKRELGNVNKDYFGSYSAFGIHREMLSDRIRTNAYRDAIVANPTLIKNAVVMDVGCGTGILSLFAAQGGASQVIAVDGSSKMASVASQIAKANGFLKETVISESRSSSIMTVVSGMIEELDSAMPVEEHGVDVLVSEWMGYCLLFESMLPSVLHARDRWLKPGGAILPDSAEMYVAGFGKGGTSLPFWEDVYGFDMRCVGDELVLNATQAPIIDVIDSKDVITTSSLIQAFDIATMKESDVDFTAQFVLELLPSVMRSEISGRIENLATNEPCKISNSEVVWCYGLVVWFDVGFTERFCKEKPVLLTTSPHSPKTHWSQTLLTFREPIALCAPGVLSEKMDKGKVGSEGHPACTITGRISIARSHRHRSIDISLETRAISSSNATRIWAVQMFDI